MAGNFDGTTIQGLFSDRANPIADLSSMRLDEAVDFADHARISHKINQIRVNAEMMGVVGGSTTSINNMNSVMRFKELVAKKEKDADRQMNSIILEQMREKMLGDIGEAITKLRDQIEQDQQRLDELQIKAEQLNTLKDLIENGTFDPTNPEHRALFEGTDVLDIAGVDSIEKFAELDPEDQKNAVDQDLGVTNDEIADLVKRIESNLEKLEILTQAEEDLLNGADPREVEARLEAAGIDLSAINEELNADHAWEISDNVFHELKLTENEFSELTEQEQAEFIVLANGSNIITQDKIDGFKALMSDDAQAILKNLENNGNTGSFSPSSP